MKPPHERTTGPSSTIRAALLWAFTLFATSVAHAEPNAGPAPLYPFLPELTLNEEPELCDGFLAATREAFLSKEYSVDIEGKPWPGLSGERFKWLFWRPEYDGYKRTKPPYRWIHRTMIDGEPVDLDGDGVDELLVLTSWEHSWRGMNYGLAVLPGEQAFQDYLELLEAGKPTEPLGGVSIAGLNYWTLPATLTFDGRAYLASLLPHYKYLGASKFTLTRLTPSGKGAEACVVQVYGDGLPKGAPPVVLELPETLGKIAGGECGGGTLQPAARLASRSNATMLRVLYRPWAARGLRPYNSSEQVWSHLVDWAYHGVGSLGSWRLYDELDWFYNKTAGELGSFYSSGFGYDHAAADRLAADNVDWLLRQYFIFPGQDLGYPRPEVHKGYERTASLRENYLQSDEHKVVMLLRRMALEGGPPKEVDKVLDAYRKGGGSVDSLAALPLDAALQHPQILQRFLAAGAEVNQTNPFGKTPLMYAAHYNLPQAAKVLLGAGADPNLRTRKHTDCPYYVTIGQRSALTYALENASVELIQMLLDKGADATVTDSSGRDALEYLDMNAGLDNLKMTRVREMLIERGAKP